MDRLACVRLHDDDPGDEGQGQALSAVGVVIGIHIAFMYFPSLVTGVLVDKLGRIPVAIAAGVTLRRSTAPQGDMLHLTIALALLGLGCRSRLVRKLRAASMSAEGLLAARLAA